MIFNQQNNQKKAFSFALVRLNKPTKGGFSLIEVLVTLLVLTISITGVTFLMAKNIAGVQNSKNQIIASMLAQEGIELVRNLKDNKETIVNCSNCRINMLSTNVEPVSDKKLYLSNNFYRHGSGTSTKFYRRVDVSIALVGTTNEIKVTSYVTWNNVGFGGLSNITVDCTTANKCVSVTSVMPDLY